MHFNQCFSLVPCPLKGFPQGQEFKNWTNKHKGNKHRKQTDRQVEKSCATLRPGAAKGLLHTPSLTPWGRHSLAHLLPTLAMYGSLWPLHCVTLDNACLLWSVSPTV